MLDSTNSSRTHVVALDALASYVSDAPYKNQRLGLMAPGMLREVGDVAYLAALCLPRRVVIAGGVRGDGTKLSAEVLRTTFDPALRIGRIMQTDDALQTIGSDDIDRIINKLLR